MKTKKLLLLLLIIILKTNCFAQTETESFQFKNESAGIYFQSNSLNSFQLNGSDLLTRQNIKRIILDSPIIKVDSFYVEPEGLKTKIPQALIVPGLLIAYGLTTLGNHGLYSSHQSRADVMKLTGGKGSNIDNYLVVAPYLEFGALLLLKV